MVTPSPPRSLSSYMVLHLLMHLINRMERCFQVGKEHHDLDMTAIDAKFADRAGAQIRGRDGTVNSVRRTVSLASAKPTNSCLGNRHTAAKGIPKLNTKHQAATT